MAKVIFLLFVALAFGSFIECRSLHRLKLKKNLHNAKNIEIGGLSDDIKDNNIKLIRLPRSGSGKSRRIPGALNPGEPRDVNRISEMVNNSLNDGSLCGVKGAAPGEKVPCSSKYEVIWSLVDDGTADIKFYASSSEEINML